MALLLVTCGADFGDVDELPESTDFERPLDQSPVPLRQEFHFILRGLPTSVLKVRIELKMIKGGGNEK